MINLDKTYLCTLANEKYIPYLTALVSGWHMFFPKDFIPVVYLFNEAQNYKDILLRANPDLNFVDLTVNLDQHNILDSQVTLLINDNSQELKFKDACFCCNSKIQCIIDILEIDNCRRAIWCDADLIIRQKSKKLLEALEKYDFALIDNARYQLSGDCPDMDGMACLIPANKKAIIPLKESMKNVIRSRYVWFSDQKNMTFFARKARSQGILNYGLLPQKYGDHHLRKTSICWNLAGDKARRRKDVIDELRRILFMRNIKLEETGWKSV